MSASRFLRGLTCVAVVAMAARAWGHAIVTGTSLDRSPVHTGTPTQVTLKLNSKIEPAFTRVSLVDAAGATTPLETTGDTPGEIVVKLPALGAGRYGLRYRVLAADGHVTENVVRFRVEP